MLTLMLGTIILALTYGAFWHNQPARRQNDEKGGDDFRFGRPAKRALEWLLLMPHVSNPLEKSECLVAAGKGVIPSQTGLFRPVVRALRGFKPWRRILMRRTGVEPSIPADLFGSKAGTNALAAGRTI